MARKMMDCREMPSDTNCSILISGEEEEVVRAATEHAVSVHGETDSPEFRRQIRTSLKDEPIEMQGLGDRARMRVDRETIQRTPLS